MKQTRIIMGMPVTLDVADVGIPKAAEAAIMESVFAYFTYIDEKFSPYKAESELSLINNGCLRKDQASEDMQIIFALAEQTRQATDGYFNIDNNGCYDPSGIVKGWAINYAAIILHQKGLSNFYVEAGGDLQVAGKNHHGEKWQVGIRNPFDPDQIVKVLAVSDCGVATSGTYLQGQHIYNPRDRRPITDIVSLTVIGPTIYDADRFATAAFAMGQAGIQFIETLDGFEGYLIDRDRQATFTSGFVRYVAS